MVIAVNFVEAVDNRIVSFKVTCVEQPCCAPPVRAVVACMAHDHEQARICSIRGIKLGSSDFTWLLAPV